MEKMKSIALSLVPYEVSVFEAFVGVAKEYTVHGVIMVPKGQWPDTVLLHKLRELPPAVSIKIDPDTLL